MYNITKKEAEEAGYIKNKYFRSGTSFPEQFIYRCLLQIFSRVENRVIDSDLELEFDIFVPELNLRIEYSGKYWHDKEDAKVRDNRRREYCKANKLPYIEIWEGENVRGIELVKEERYLLYKFKAGTSYNDKVAKLVEIVEDILNRFGITAFGIDYARAMYEAFLLSTPYRYTLVQDEDGNIVGKQYMEPVCYNGYVKAKGIEQLNSRRLLLRPVVKKSDMLIQDDYDMLNQLMFNGNSLDEITPAMRGKTGIYEEEIITEQKMRSREREINRIQEEIRADRESVEIEKDKLRKERKSLEFEREELEKQQLALYKREKGINEIEVSNLLNKIDKLNYEYTEARKCLRALKDRTDKERENRNMLIDELRKENESDYKRICELSKEINENKITINKLILDREARLHMRNCGEREEQSYGLK